MHPLDVFTQMEHLIDEDTVIVLDGGDYVQWGRSYFQARKPGHFMRLGPLSHLGAAVPYGMAAKLANPKSKVLVFTGDGALNPAARRFREADVVLLLGKRLDHRYGYGKVFGAGAKIIQADASPAEIGRNRGVTVGLLGDLGAIVDQITEAAGKLPAGGITPWLDQLKEDRAGWTDSL